MIRALVWKEFREQVVIVVALAVLGCGLIAAIGILNPTTADVYGWSTGRFLTDPGVLTFVMLLVSTGVVVGGTLFAGERERGTNAFFTTLPVARWRLWAGKIVGGGVLVLGVTAVLSAAAAAVGLLPASRLAAVGLGVGAFALAAFGWGAVGSVLARNSLTGAGLGALFGALGAATVYPLGVMAVMSVGRNGRLFASDWGDVSVAWAGTLLTVFALFSLPFLISAWFYTAPDRNRRLRAVLGSHARPARSAAGGARKSGPRFTLPRMPRLAPAVRASVWLVWKQTRVPTLVLSVLGLLCGLSLLIPDVPAVIVWPSVTLFLGVLIGVVGWADEQGNGAGRFWLERRMPTGRMWLAKVLGGLLSTLTIAVATALPFLILSAVRKFGRVDHGSHLLFEYGFPLVRFTLLWPVYGFAVGHLVGLLFRKPIVSVAVGTMLAAVAAAAWLPSLLGGGVSHWQVWAPAVVVLLTARLLVWAMAADRVGGRRAITRLAVGGAAVLAAFAVGLGYRVLEIPDVPERNDDLAFKANDIPPFEGDDARREIRRGGVLLSEFLTGRRPTDADPRGNEPTPEMYYSFAQEPAGVFQDGRRRQLEAVIEHGWAGDPDLAAWLDRVFATGWAEAVELGVSKPLGTLEDPRDLLVNSPLRHLTALDQADTLLLVQALRKQANGDPTAFVKAADTVLGLSRNVRNKSVLACGLAARRMERRVYQALPRWLERLHARADLVAELGCILEAHDAWAKPDADDVRLAEQVVLRNSFQSAGELLRRRWRYTFTDTTEDERRLMDIETDLVALAWRMPWETERHERLIGAGNRQGYPPREPFQPSPFLGLPGLGWMTEHRSSVMPRDLTREDTSTTAARRIAQVLLAIRLYELAHDGPPPSLDALVPDYLPAKPIDPGSGASFAFRHSQGEELRYASRTPPPLPPPLPDELVARIAVAGVGGATDALWLLERPNPYDLYQSEVFVPAGRPIVWSVRTARYNGPGLMTPPTAFGQPTVLLHVAPAPPPGDRP
jgi:hypothetical protein